VAEAAAAALSAIDATWRVQPPTKTAVVQLLATLTAPGDAVAVAAAAALGVIGDNSAVGPLIVALEAADARLRGAAAAALGKIGGDAAVRALTGAMKDTEAGVRKSVIKALVATGDARALDPFIVALQTDSDEMVRYDLVEVLKQRSEPRVSSVLVAALADSDLKRLDPQHVEWTNGTPLMRGAVLSLMTMNRAMHPEKATAREWLSADVMAALDHLFANDARLLDQMNLGHLSREWRALKSGNGTTAQ